MSKNDSTIYNPGSRNRQYTWTNAGRRGVALAALACLLGAQSLMVPARAADWGYDSDYADDKENDPKFADHKSNVRPPKTRDPIQQADDIDGGNQSVGELDAAPAALNPPKGQKNTPRAGSKPPAKAGVSKPNSKLTKPAASPNPVADPSTFGSSDDMGSDSNVDSNSSTDSPDQAQQSDSSSDANFERDPVYREGISLPTSKVPVDQQKKIINAWINLFGLCAPIEGKGQIPKGPDFSAQFTDQQKARFTVVLKKMLSGKEQAGYKQIDNYWSALSRLLQNVDHRSNYRVLFRSLLSMRADAPDISADERGMLNEALGPKRIAEIGPPPLTEDAIEAYTDMTCFLYEQSHDGKTVDAEDNRALYGMIIRDKFKKAPSDRDRMAMNQFPLSWAKFRILYTDANPSEKVLLAERMASEKGTKGLGIRNAMLEQVLSTPVWMRFVVGSNKVMATSNAGAATAKPRTSGGALKSGGFKTDALHKRMDSLSREMDAEALSFKGSAPRKKAGAKTGGFDSQTKTPTMKASSPYMAVRLTPGTDVREFLEQWCRDKKIEAGVILTMVGSLKTASIRFAGKPEPTVIEGPFEIVSTTGTLSPDGCHVHLAIADKDGKMLGGHLSKGSKVNTTIELVVLNLSDGWRFERIPDPVTKDPELHCVPKSVETENPSVDMTDGL